MIQVIKANGKIESFNEEKLRYSIKRSGANKDLEDKIIAHIKNKLYNNIPSSEIYNHITEFLYHSQTPHLKARYSLKQAIMALGPTGHPFEDLIDRIFKSRGFETQTRRLLKGKCVTHEVDVLAKKGDEHIMIEAKFHNSLGIHTQIHVSLYTKARFDDLKDINNLTQGMLVTNTRATAEAIDYANCSGLKIITWSYPPEGSLRDLIETSGLHPLTSLTTLSQGQKQQLLERHFILCKDLYEQEEALYFLNLLPQKKEEVLREAKLISASQ